MMLGRKRAAAMASNALPNKIASMIAPIGTAPTKLLTMLTPPSVGYRRRSPTRVRLNIHEFGRNLVRARAASEQLGNRHGDHRLDESFFGFPDTQQSSTIQ